VFEPTGTLADIIPEAQRPFRALLREMRRRGLDPEILPLGAGRTCAQQNAIDPAATGATGCESWHVLGRALDIGINAPTCDNYRSLGEWWEARGGFWGGRWTQFGGCGDAGHFHWPETPGEGSPHACPTNPAECARFREEYLQAAQAWRPFRAWWGVAAGLVVVGAYVAWDRTR